MDAVLFLIILSLTFLVFFIPKNYKYHYTLFLLIGAIVLSSVWCYKVLAGNLQVLLIDLDFPFFGNRLILTIDSLSAFFTVVINITILVGLLYARGYLRPYQQTKNSLSFSIHFFSYLWLYLSMILVVMIHDGLTFLIVWEVMAISSFLLVIFEAENRIILKTGISYLIQMHVGMFFILVAFLLVGKVTGQMSFDSLRLYFSNHSNYFLFVLFFIGFGIKAGFVPMHTWLPEAHPAAPSHVSGVMSGVMIKMGIYGIMRVLMSVQNNLLLIGVTILLISLITGIFGIMMAIMQRDLKRLLAYSSIENIGIIGIGMGSGVIGMATHNPYLSLLGFSGGLLHVLNHSLFKSLLFFNSGSVYHEMHTRNIEQMGGLMKKMPHTAILFLVGALAISGLPPFNGFISEYLIYIGMFKSLSAANLIQSIIVLGSIVGLALIGGLAIFCFTKAFGIVFLGEARSERAKMVREVSRDMLFPQLITVTFIVAIGLASVLFVKPVSGIISQAFNLTNITGISTAYLDSLDKISLICGIFIVSLVSLLIYRHYHLKKRHVSYGPTWGCGYTAGTFKQQYTATSYTYNYNHLAKPVLLTRKIMRDIREDEIFPDERTFESHSTDIFKKYLINRPVNWLSEILKKIAVMQTGQIQHYILYAFIYMLVVFILTYFNII
jgi:hydrogenase-4 component B